LSRDKCRDQGTWGKPEKRDSIGVTTIPPPIPRSPDRKPAHPPAPPSAIVSLVRQSLTVNLDSRASIRARTQNPSLSECVLKHKQAPVHVPSSDMPCVCVCVCVFVCRCIYTHARAHTHTHTHTRARSLSLPTHSHIHTQRRRGTCNKEERDIQWALRHGQELVWCGGC